MMISPDDNACVLFLIRHGATDYNLRKPTVLQGNGIDGPLAEIGKQQAAQVGEYLKSFSLDAIYASPMKRAVETAQAIAKHHTLAVQTIPEIVEADVGRWLGRDWEEIIAAEPEAYRRHIEDPSIHPYPEGENVTDVSNRCVPVLLDLMKKSHGKRIAVVAHNIVNRVMVAHLHHIPLRLFRVIRQDNCCINVIRHTADGAQLITSNSIFHLHGDSSSA